eukprot:15099355-Alexandrium_andersonii.AAC.1
MVRRRSARSSNAERCPTPALLTLEYCAGEAGPARRSDLDRGHATAARGRAAWAQTAPRRGRRRCLERRAGGRAGTA